MNGRGIDYSRLASILMNPDDKTPDDLVNALYFVHEMATLEGMNQLLQAAREKGLVLKYDSESYNGPLFSDNVISSKPSLTWRSGHGKYTQTAH